MVKKFSKDLKEFKRKMERATKNKSGQVTFDTLFNQGFMAEYTEFKTLDEMFNNEGLKIETEEDFKALDEIILDKMVKKHTRFNSWTEMLNKAAEEYMGKEIKKRF